MQHPVESLHMRDRAAHSQATNSEEVKMRTISILLMLGVFATASHAQVYKCQSAQGRAIYSDSPCEYGARALDPKLLRSNSLDTSGARRQAREADKQEDERYRAVQNEVPRSSTGAAGGNICPTEQEIRNMETSASSISHRDSKFMQAEIRRARACIKEGVNYTKDDWKHIKEGQDAQGNISAKDRAKGRQTAEEIHYRAGSESVRQQMLDAQATEQARVAQRRATGAAQAAQAAAQANAGSAAGPSYDRIARCIYDNCQGTSGAKYTPLPGVANEFKRQDGRRCQRGPSGELTCW